MKTLKELRSEAKKLGYKPWFEQSWNAFDREDLNKIIKLWKKKGGGK